MSGYMLNDQKPPMVSGNPRLSLLPDPWVASQAPLLPGRHQLEAELLSVLHKQISSNKWALIINMNLDFLFCFYSWFDVLQKASAQLKTGVTSAAKHRADKVSGQKSVPAPMGNFPMCLLPLELPERRNVGFFPGGRVAPPHCLIWVSPDVKWSIPSRWRHPLFWVWNIRDTSRQ